MKKKIVSRILIGVIVAVIVMFTIHIVVNGIDVGGFIGRLHG